MIPISSTQVGGIDPIDPRRLKAKAGPNGRIRLPRIALVRPEKYPGGGIDPAPRPARTKVRADIRDLNNRMNNDRVRAMRASRPTSSTTDLTARNAHTPIAIRRKFLLTARHISVPADEKVSATTKKDHGISARDIIKACRKIARNPRILDAAIMMVSETTRNVRRISAHNVMKASVKIVKEPSTSAAAIMKDSSPIVSSRNISVRVIVKNSTDSGVAPNVLVPIAADLKPTAEDHNTSAPAVMKVSWVIIAPTDNSARAIITDSKEIAAAHIHSASAIMRASKATVAVPAISAQARMKKDSKAIIAAHVHSAPAIAKACKAVAAQVISVRNVKKVFKAFIAVQDNSVPAITRNSRETAASTRVSVPLATAVSAATSVNQNISVLAITKAPAKTTASPGIIVPVPAANSVNIAARIIRGTRSAQRRDGIAARTDRTIARMKKTASADFRSPLSIRL